MRILTSRRTGVITVALAALLTLLVAAAPARAAISSLSMVASNNQVNATDVTHTITFQVGAADLGLAVTMPEGITGLDDSNVSVETSSDGSSFGAVTPSSSFLSSDGQRAAVNLPVALTPGTWVRLTITGLTNPSATGDITVSVGGALTAITQAVLDVVASLEALLAETADLLLSIVALATNGVSVDVSVAPALSLSISSASHSWSLDPSGTSSSSNVYDDITLATNAGSYAIQAYVSGDLIRVGTDGSSSSDAIPLNGPANGPHFGYKVSGPAGDSVNASTLRSWSTGPASLVSGWSLSGLTNGETTRVTYDVAVDYTKAPGKYVGSITYRVVPTY